MRLAFRHPLVLPVLLLGLLTVGCSPHRKRARSVGESVENHDQVTLPGHRIELLEAPGRPSLQLIRRSGDPSGAMGIAVFTPGGSADALLLGTLLRTRLNKGAGEHPLALQIHSLGVVLSQEVETPRGAARWMQRVHTALNTPVAREEAETVPAGAFFQATAGRAGEASPFEDCMGVLGAEGGERLRELAGDFKKDNLHEELERVRQASAVATRVGLSALGEAEFVDAAAQAHDGDWAEGEPIDDSWSTPREVTTIRGAGGREVRVALRVTDSEAALAGARALREEDHPLHARLHALDPHVEAGPIDVTLRPAGACVGLTVSLGTEGSAPDAHKVAEIALMTTEELLATVRQSLTEDERSLMLLSPQGAVEAAALAAWTAVRSARTGGRVQEIIEYRAPGGPSISDKALDAKMASVAAEWEKRAIPMAVRDESGQAELWMLVASPCGTAPETPEETGLRALTVSAAARNFSGLWDVALEPWVATDGIGLLAHAPPLRGESVARHAERVARALGAALSGPPLDGRAVAATRDSLLDRQGSDPGEELSKSILGAGFPSLLDPWGTAKALSAFSVADVQRAREDLADEPLRLVVLASEDEAQGTAAQRALSRWLAPLRQHPSTCPSRDPDPAAPGTWTLETVEEDVPPGAFVGVFAPAPPVLGHATAYLLNRPGGYLDRAFSSPGLAANVVAEWLGGQRFGALRLRIAAEAHLLGPAVEQARAVLAALAEGNMPVQDAELAEIRRQDLEAQAERSQRARLVELFQRSRSSKVDLESPLTAQNLREFHRKLGADTHRVVLVKRRE